MGGCRIPPWSTIGRPWLAQSGRNYGRNPGLADRFLRIPVAIVQNVNHDECIRFHGHRFDDL
ncbi:MAG: hypothetical protein BYD32DRAFT_405701 [Podila humilis]|nr:MAG: hypothetical protein BYD32DRAFT_405701 [Podila humilis]